MQSNNPFVSIVIVNYNVKELLEACLRSIFLYKDDIPTEVIVVDNASHDDSLSMIHAHFPQVKTIGNKHNLGFPAANNQAFRIATGKYIFMLNPDTELQKGSLKKMLDKMEEDNSIALLGPRLLNSDLTHQQSCWRFPTLKYLLAEVLFLNNLIGSKNYNDKDLSKAQEVDSLSGAAIFFRSELLLTVGFLDEYLFWIEDVDFCYRAKKKGLKVLYFPEATIVHHVGESAKKNYNISVSNQVFNKIKFYNRHHSLYARQMITAISLLQVLSRIVMFTLLSPFKKVYRLKNKAYMYTLPKIFNPPKGIK